MDTFFARKARDDAARAEGFHKNEQHYLKSCFELNEGDIYMARERN